MRATRVNIQDPCSLATQHIFNQVDVDRDGKITYKELHEYVSRNKLNMLPKNLIVGIREKANKNEDVTINFDEFKTFVNSCKYNNRCEEYLNKYIKILLPPPTPPSDVLLTKFSFEEEMLPQRRGRGIDLPERGRSIPRGIEEEEVSFRAMRARQISLKEDEPYEEALLPLSIKEEDFYEERVYRCYPPKIAMIVISLIEIILFVINNFSGNIWKDSSIAQALMYNPLHRIEIWRYFTYMLVHTGAWHLSVNVLIQLMLGVPLEMVHQWWCVIIVYFSGVIAGSLGSSVSNPYALLAGASGGVYALMTAHIISIIANWKRMPYPLPQLFVFVVIITTDVSMIIINVSMGNIDNNISYAAHLFGGLAGLLVSTIVLKNYTLGSHGKIIGYIFIVISLLLVLSAIIYNIIADHNFPKRYN